MNILSQIIHGINIEQLLQQDDRMYRATLRAKGTVEAGQTLPTDLTVSNRGLFLLLSITGTFTTLDYNGEIYADDSYCRMSFTMKNNNGRVYIPEPLDMDQFLTPGRVNKGFANATGEILPSNSLQFPGMFFPTVWRPKDVITVTVQNTSQAPNSWSMGFHGLWLIKGGEG